MNYLGDTNFFLALTLADHPHHQSAVKWLDDLPESSVVFVCRATQTSYLRLLTVREWLKDQVCTNDKAIKHFRDMMQDSRISFFVGEPRGLQESWMNFASSPQSSPKLWMDAFLAAFALTAKLTLVTFDRGFSAFPSVRVQVLK